MGMLVTQFSDPFDIHFLYHKRHLNFRLDDVTLIPTMRKPFDVLAEGLVSQSSRGDWI